MRTRQLAAPARLVPRLGLHARLRDRGDARQRARASPDAVREAQEYTWQTLESGFRPGMGQHIPDRLFWAREDEARATSAMTLARLCSRESRPQADAACTRHAGRRRTAVLVAQVDAALDGGAALSSTATRRASAALRLEQARALARLRARSGVLFIVNDDVELARAVGRRRRAPRRETIGEIARGASRTAGQADRRVVLRRRCERARGRSRRRRRLRRVRQLLPVAARSPARCARRCACSRAGGASSACRSSRSAASRCENAASADRSRRRRASR